jgi:hypothetical protein
MPAQALIRRLVPRPRRPASPSRPHRLLAFLALLGRPAVCLVGGGLLAGLARLVLPVPLRWVLLLAAVVGGLSWLMLLVGGATRRRDERR